MAPGLGLEPRPNDPESLVLPLHHPGVCFATLRIITEQSGFDKSFSKKIHAAPPPCSFLKSSAKNHGEESRPRPQKTAMKRAAVKVFAEVFSKAAMKNFAGKVRLDVRIKEAVKKFQQKFSPKSEQKQ